MCDCLKLNLGSFCQRAVEAAGDVDTLLLDKTGTITLGDSQAAAIRPIRGIHEQELADAAFWSPSLNATVAGVSLTWLPAPSNAPSVLPERYRIHLSLLFRFRLRRSMKELLPNFVDGLRDQAAWA
jgi:high-affinity K+ transport system ATPase subunit B